VNVGGRAGGVARATARPAESNRLKLEVHKFLTTVRAA
jgi:hypothetical protein